MSKFIKWVGDYGYSPTGQHLYTLNHEDTLGDPRWWEPWCISQNPQHTPKSLPAKFYPQEWMTKPRAKEACEKHYIATHTEDEQ